MNFVNKPINLNKIFTQINSGKLKGKKLLIPPKSTTRSTKSLVKGSFFDTFRFEFANKIFIEMFAGSGVMAAEALSNGAKKCYGFEKDSYAFSILKLNFKNIDENLVAINKNCFKGINLLLEDINDEFIIYFDPPFDIRDGYDDIYKKVCETIKKLSNYNAFLVAIEHNSDVKFDETIGKFKLFKSKKFGKTSMTYFKKEI
ncbi:16S rRNA (guanine(966)-N(2))-methyltransferase RsmD [Campylobacter ureolyticus]|uniref:16S rRNA (Guanine(966)-N(2))-methyltransferase RsmD n=1 Tax=Campylobacter ureolyticus TaxID=827 RepID=A0A9Q4PVV3_9BACT|nr:16S rRNA (guanine(966)-N(2))-methyltransferase RsmD [Campylobacter ureolyticus]MDU5033081.1 16S rRNA (guanine(966)-N(2))-methyltransferase RsmD [Clostridium perfringens]MCZ6103975.1 16S rRNA (guanine(966)-N(2))-methyltransferase RsmD [Campylobacter ureolyticus]MCZ6135204.1 16S rRNA (guanine(966)-N(2))-methyltransferase RsmD [Campylobacter ureolyticus]MCZ6162294.1 16S rRNA (guanine(966)-N(2))-methyltransferase RsmD [Campylobacter ureolyticus]MCZ6171084.1 16S rRNA (guanine(966)-N(2))-methyltr